MGPEAQIELLPWGFQMLAWNTPKFERASPDTQQLVLSCIETMCEMWKDLHRCSTLILSLEVHPKGGDFMPLLIHGLFLVAGHSPSLPPLIYCSAIITHNG